MNLQHTYVRGVLATTAPDSGDVRERVLHGGAKVNHAPERAASLASIPICPCCFTNVHHTERRLPPLHVAVACGNCGWSGIAGQVLEWR